MYERQAYEIDGRFQFWGGLAVGTVDGGRGLIDMHAAAAARSGIEVRHEAAVEELVRGSGGRRASLPDGTRRELRARSVVLAAGGFESNPAMRAGYLGPNWDVAKVRGTPHNTGEVLRAALAAGAQAYGHWSGCHAIQWDRDAPPTGDLELTNRFSRQSYPVGIVVNADGERFIDEGADFRNYTYAKYGAEVLRQPRAWPPRSSTRARRSCCARSTTRHRARHASTPTALRELAEGLGIDADASSGRSREYNAASSTGRVRPGGQGRAAHRGLAVPKSNWALPIDTPPYTAFPVTCGITFTFGGAPRRCGRARARRRRPPVAGPVRGGRARRRPVLPQLPGRQRPHCGRRLRAPRGLSRRQG